MSLPTISAAELAQHASPKSCYVTIGNKVYDVTEFLADHPGGEDLVLEYAGKDVREILADEISHHHSEAAYEILDDYHIGFLAPSLSADQSLPPSPPRTPSGQRVPFSKTGISSAEELSLETDFAADYRKNKFLDLSKPLLMQVFFGGFSKDFYLDQIHRPRHYKGGDSAPLFGNFLEPLSKTPWWIIPTLWWPCVAYGTYIAANGMDGEAGIGAAKTGAFWMCGLALWSLIEYGLHRCLFHIDEKMPDNRVAITLHFLLHGIHHYLPMDKLRLVMPPTLFIALATPFWHLAHAIFRWNWYIATAVYCGGIFGYTCYDMTHYFLHHKSLPAYYRELKKYHLQHHFADYHKGYGVTSKFWDRVFGTELIYGPSGNPVAGGLLKTE